jgi:hypothetical protein
VHQQPGSHNLVRDPLCAGSAVSWRTGAAIDEAACGTYAHLPVRRLQHYDRQQQLDWVAAADDGQSDGPDSPVRQSPHTP